MMPSTNHNLPTRDGGPSAPGRLLLADALFCVAVTAVLYLRFFRGPNVPIDPAMGDQPMFLWGALKIIDGQVIYRDFFQFTTPGTEFVYAGLIKIFGQTAMVAKMATLFAGSAFCVVGLYVARKVIAGGIRYAVPLVFLTAGFLPEPDVTHHVFSALAVMCGVALLLADADRESSSSALWVAAGVSFGVASFFTTTRGFLMVAVLVVMLFLPRAFAARQSKVSRATWLVVGFTVTFSCLFLPVLWKAGWQNTFDCVVRFPLEHYRSTPQTSPRAYGIDLPPQALFSVSGILAVSRWGLVYFVTPGVYVLAAYRLWKTRADVDEPERKKVLLLIAAGIGLFLSVAYSPNQFRMGMVSIPAIVLLFWVLSSEPRGISRCIAFSIGLFALVSVPAGVFHSQAQSGTRVETPAGVIVITGAQYEARTQKFLWIKAHTQPGDSFFTPDHLEYDYLFRLQHPGPVPYLSIYDYTTPQQVQATIDEIEKHRVRYVFWPLDVQKVTVNTEGAPPAGDHLKPLRRYRKDHYTLIYRFSDFEEVWERKSD